MNMAVEPSSQTHDVGSLTGMPQLPDIAATNNPDVEHAVAALLSRTSTPRKALGRVEQLAAQLARIQFPRGTPFGDLEFEAPQAVVFAADHGVADEGVAELQQSATLSAVLDLLTGKGHANRLATLQGFELSVVDAGVSTHVKLPDDAIALAPLQLRKIGYGTRNVLMRPAMSAAQAASALEAGMDVARHLPGNVLSISGLGVASEASAAMLLSRLCGVPLADAVGHDPDLDDIRNKARVEKLFTAMTRHRKAITPLDALAALGGFEIAMMTGAMLQAASERRVVIVDGYSAGAAALVARTLSPNVSDYLIHAHRSQDPGHRLLLIHMQTQPLLDLDMKTGEMVGGLLAWPLMLAAQALLRAKDQTLPEVELP